MLNLKKIYSSDLFKHSTTLLSSNVISQGIAIAVYPIITRIYAPELFAEFTFFLSIAAVLAILSSGKYECAIVLPKSEKRATALLQLCLILNLCLFILLSFLVFIWKTEIIHLLNHEKTVQFLPFLPLIVLLTGLWQTFNFFFIRHKKFKTISIYNISQSVIGSGLKCLFGIKSFLQLGLIWGQLSGQLLATIVSLVLNYSQIKKIKKIDFSEIKNAAKIYSNFPKYELPNGLLNTFAGNMPILLLPAFFGMEKIGLFSLALTIGLGSVTLFSKSVYQILLQRMSKRIQEGEKLIHECLMFCRICLIFILPFFILLLFIPENIFSILFGQKWIGFGFYLKLLSPCLFLSILVASLSFIPDIFFKQKTAMYIECIYVIFKVLSLFLGIYLHNFNIAIISYCCIVTLMLGIKLGWYFRLIKKYELSKKSIHD